MWLGCLRVCVYLRSVHGYLVGYILLSFIPLDMARLPQSRPCVHDHEEATAQPIQQLSPVPYCPKSEGIKVIQQYVSTIVEEISLGETCAQEGDIWDYDLIGAVGLKAGAKKNRATVVYHVKWKSFPLSDMTWEPESHFPRGDLEIIWSTHGRVNAGGEVLSFSKKDPESHQHSTDHSSASPRKPASGAAQLSHAELSQSQPMEQRIALVPNVVSTTDLLRPSSLPWLGNRGQIGIVRSQSPVRE